MMEDGDFLVNYWYGCDNRNLDFRNDSIPKCCRDDGNGIEDSKDAVIGVTLQGIVFFWPLGWVSYGRKTRKKNEKKTMYENNRLLTL